MNTEKKTKHSKFERTVFWITLPWFLITPLIAMVRWEREERNRCTYRNLICKYARKCKQSADVCRHSAMLCIVTCLLLACASQANTLISTSVAHDTLGSDRMDTYSMHIQQHFQFHWKW